MKKVQILLQDMKRAQQLADFLTPIPGTFSWFPARRSLTPKA